MEKYMKNCRMILLSTHLHRLINPIRSRCLNIRVPAPSPHSIAQVLAEVGKIESTSFSSFHFTESIYQQIANNCDRNLRMALIQLQATRYTKSTEGQITPYKK
jgi:replication factor C subunit 3/5